MPFKIAEPRAGKLARVVGVEPSTSGVAARDFAAALRDIVGREAYEAGLARLPEEDRRRFVGANARSWVPLRITTAVTNAVAAEVGEDPEGLVDRAIRRATERTLTTVWRMLFRLTSTAALVKRLPTLWARSRNVGEVEVVEVGDDHGKIVLRGWPGRMPSRQARLFAVNLETALELLGRRDVTCHWKRTDDGAVYRLSWRR